MKPFCGSLMSSLISWHGSILACIHYFLSSSWQEELWPIKWSRFHWWLLSMFHKPSHLDIWGIPTNSIWNFYFCLPNKGVTFIIVTVAWYCNWINHRITYVFLFKPTIYISVKTQKIIISLSKLSISHSSELLGIYTLTMMMNTLTF